MHLAGLDAEVALVLHDGHEHDGLACGVLHGHGDQGPVSDGAGHGRQEDRIGWQGLHLHLVPELANLMGTVSYMSVREIHIYAIHVLMTFFNICENKVVGCTLGLRKATEPLWILGTSGE